MVLLYCFSPEVPVCEIVLPDYTCMLKGSAAVSPVAVGAGCGVTDISPEGDWGSFVVLNLMVFFEQTTQVFSIYVKYIIKNCLKRCLNIKFPFKLRVRGREEAPYFLSHPISLRLIQHGSLELIFK